jgi:hypothetical protein
LIASSLKAEVFQFRNKTEMTVPDSRRMLAPIEIREGALVIMKRGALSWKRVGGWNTPSSVNLTSSDNTHSVK